jgi:hypothetical protein
MGDLRSKRRLCTLYSTVTLQEFKETFAAEVPPTVEPALVALWHDARGDWEAAHKVAQDIRGTTGAWIHAYLHRKEGDLANARYWYERAQRAEARDSLESEWTRIASALLSN